MKRMFAVLGIVLSCGATFASGTATLNDPGLSYYKINVTWPTLPPVPVYVVNLPAEQTVNGTVNIGNLPTVQTVNGTVNVGNLPAVQQVGGTVSVGNLPLADDGSVRVATGPAKQPVSFELVTAPLDFTGHFDIPTIIDTNGYSAIGIFARASLSGATVYPEWSWSDDEEFVQVYDDRGGLTYQGASACYGVTGYRYACRNTGGRLKVHLFASSETVISSVRVYLFP